MRKPIVVLTLSLTLLATNALSLPGFPPHHQALAQSAQAQSLRVVILPFKNITRNPDDEWLSDSFAESLTMGLLHVDALHLVERSQVQKLLQEQQFSQSGYVDESSAPKLGKLLGAKIVVLGSYQKVGDQLQANVRFVDVETGQVDSKKAAQVEGQFKQIFALQKRLATTLISNLDVQARPEEIKQLEKTITATDSPEAYRHYMEGVELLRRSGALRQDDALKAFQKALIEDPNYALAYAGLAEGHARKFRERAALIVLPPSQGFEAMGVNDEVKAEEYARKALALDPDLPQLYRALAYLKQQQGQKKEALQLIQRAVQMNPKDVDSLIAYLTFRYESAKVSLDFLTLKNDLLAMGANLNDPWLQYNLGIYAFGIEAIKPQPQMGWVRDLFEQAYLKLPDYPYLPLMIGSVLYREAKMDQAQAYFDKALALGHDDAHVLLTISALYIQVKRTDEAFVLVQQAEKLQPNDIFVLAAKADILYAKGQKQAAEVLYNQLEQKAPENTYLHFTRGIQYLIQDQDYKKSAIYLEKALKHWDKNPSGISRSFIRFFLGMAYINQDDFVHAQPIFEELREDPTYYGQAYEALASIYVDQEKYADAIEAYTAYLTIHPEASEDPRVKRKYRKYYLLNQWANGEENVAVLNDLGQIAIVEKAYKLAQAYYDRALELEPNNPVVRYNLGLVYLSQKDAAQALPHLQAAVKLKPDYLKAWYNLGLAYQGLKQNDYARTAWQKALQLDPAYEDARQALKQL